MKKILVILSVFFTAAVVTSCVKPFEPTISLSLTNRTLALGSTADAHPDEIPGNFHYINITSTGSWEATLETENGSAWCWLNDHYLTARKGADGKPLKDEMGNVITDKTYIVEGVEKFKGTDKFCKVRGSGSVYLPLQFNNNQTTVRYATFYVRRLDTGETCVMNIRQSK